MDIREVVREDVIKDKTPYMLLELPTSFGKSKLALDIMTSRCTTKSKILVVIPRLILIGNWKEEFIKWGHEEYINSVEFVTYVSFPKKAGHWDLIIFDEAHHLSERCRDSLDYFDIDNAILLSATVGRNIKVDLHNSFRDLRTIKVSTKDAIDEEILPDPTVYLIPLTLDNSYTNHEIIKNKSKGNPLVVPYHKRWDYRSTKHRTIIIKCTQQQYYDNMSSMITWYKNKMYIERYKNMYLRECGNRLKWLSEQKTSFINTLLDQLSKERTLTFCSSVEQTELLGKYCINSKNKKSNTYIEDFNKGKIDHITACAMLNEGANLTNCRVGIYASLNSSDRIITQRLGRLLRHKSPIIIIPFYKHTRDEELVKKMAEDYNPSLVKIIDNLNELKL